jgi:hypothetical protein
MAAPPDPMKHALRIAVCLGLWAGICAAPLRAQRIAPRPPDDAARRAAEARYYTIERVPIPEGLVLEVGAMARGPGDSIALVTRRGDAFWLEGALGKTLSGVKFHRIASGLQEPLGVAWKDGRLWVTQRSELTELIDRDGDRVADEFRTVCDGWGLTGDPHEYAFGFGPDADGNHWITLTLTDSSKSSAFLRGWCVRVGPDGKMTPVAGGVRSAGGIGPNASGEMFYTESQGFWVGSSALHHLKPGSFQGSPVSLRWWPMIPGFGPLPAVFERGERIEQARVHMPMLVPPAVIFPYGDLGQCPTGFVVDRSNGAFGPFAGQLFVGELPFSEVERVFLEQVNGVWQGAAFPFLSGFASGPVALFLDPAGGLLVGSTNRGWGSRGAEPFALERVRWNGVTPFEVLEMRATADGFDLRFTRPVDPVSAANPPAYAMRAWTYEHTAGYGSPKADLVAPRIVAAVAGADGRSVRLTVDGRVRGHVHELKLPGVRSAEGEPLLHPVGFYTLNEIPAAQ